ncbi:hypothetical protein [Haloferula sp.]|uniref:hypothetical protein n=1 Tax=Haloferula sp. TaxID=2497595 RepID=UPI00329A986F
MPDEPQKPRNTPRRHRPRVSELSKETTEEDLWDLEDEGSSPPAAPAEPPAKAEPETKSTTPAAKTGDEPKEARPKRSKPAVSSHRTKAATAPKSEPPPRATPPKAARPNGPKALDQKLSSMPDSEAAAATTSARANSPKPTPEPKPEQPKPKPKPQAAPEQKAPVSAPAREKAEPAGKSERMALIAFGVVFLALGIWWIIGLFSSISTTRLGDDQPDFPVTGTHVTIGNAETYWREPIREGVRTDNARSEVEFIPVLKVVINDSESGVLRAIYRNEEGDFVGDSISLPFAHGLFDLNAGTEVEFPATDGFQNSGEFNGYRVGETRWTVEVFEGPSVDAAGSEFKLLFTSPISSNRQ